MKLPIKITLIVLGLVIVISVLYSADSNFAIDTMIFTYGLFACIAGAISFIAGITLLFAGQSNKSKALGFLLSAGLLLVTGFFAYSQVSFGR